MGCIESSADKGERSGGGGGGGRQGGGGGGGRGGGGGALVMGRGIRCQRLSLRQLMVGFRLTTTVSCSTSRIHGKPFLGRWKTRPRTVFSGQLLLLLRSA